MEHPRPSRPSSSARCSTAGTADAEPVEEGSVAEVLRVVAIDDAAGLAAGAAQHDHAGSAGELLGVPAGIGLRLAALALDAIAALLMAPVLWIMTSVLAWSTLLASHELQDATQGQLTVFSAAMSAAVALAFDVRRTGSIGKRLVRIRVGAVGGGPCVAAARRGALWLRWAVKASPALAVCLCCAADMAAEAYVARRGPAGDETTWRVPDSAMLALVAAALLTHAAWAVLHRGRTLHDGLARTDVFRVAPSRRGFEPVMAPPIDERNAAGRP